MKLYKRINFLRNHLRFLHDLLEARGHLPKLLQWYHYEMGCVCNSEPIAYTIADWIQLSSDRRNSVITSLLEE